MKGEKNIFQERLIERMKEKNITVSQLSKLTGIDTASISSYRTGKYRAGNDKLYKMAPVLDVDPRWLMGVIDEKKPYNPANNVDYIFRFSDEEMILIETYRKSDDEKKRLVQYLLGLK